VEQGAVSARDNEDIQIRVNPIDNSRYLSVLEPALERFRKNFGRGMVFFW